MKKFAVAMVASLLMALALGSTCFAGTSKGETAFSIAGSLSSSKPDNSSSTTSTTLVTGVNYFLMDTVSVGGQVTYFGQKNDNSNMGMTYVNLDAKYHFMPKSVLVPYVGIMAGIANLSGDTKGSGYDYGAMAGVNYFLMENASLDAELNYRKDSFKIEGQTQKQSTTTFLVGLTYYFGK